MQLSKLSIMELNFKMNFLYFLYNFGSALYFDSKLYKNDIDF